MSHHMPIFAGASLDEDTVINLYPSTEPNAVTITPAFHSSVPEKGHGSGL
jgi:hypothetical protein